MSDWRIYFNKRSEFPLIWSVDSGKGTQEIKVKDARLHRVTGITRYDPSGDNVTTPTAWVEITYAVMHLENDVANFFRDENWRQPKIGGADG